MAIGYARIEFVKRTSGKNACAKAAYNSRAEIAFEGSDVQGPTIYDWSHKSPPAHHEIILPEHVDPQFKSAPLLWNLVEQKEKRINSVPASELVLALPDDKGITLEDKIHLARTFVEHHFVEKGLAAQIDLHAPEPLLMITRDHQEGGLKRGMKGEILHRSSTEITFASETKTPITFNPQEFTGYIEKEHNWHAHVLLTTRRFKENGQELQDHKARDLMPRILKGKVVSGPDWGKLWAEHQNHYFEEKGIDLRVDPPGLVPQEHLGPYRMRARAFALFEEHHRLVKANEIASKNPAKILAAMTAQKSVFTREGVSRFLVKHAPSSAFESLLEAFWKQKEIIQLVDKKTGEPLPKFTSGQVVEEEQQILRIASRLNAKATFPVSAKHQDDQLPTLTPEQRQAFQNIISGKRISLIQGYAGTGKSHLLQALQIAYEASGCRVRAFGPDNATVDVLKEKGLSHTENVYRFLFALHHDRRKILRKEIWILDEAGKLGTPPLLEFLREASKRGAQVILSGDAAQLPPVERGGMFKTLCEQFNSQVLQQIQRQKSESHRQMARRLALGEMGVAIDQLSAQNGICFAANQKEAIEALILKWSKETQIFPSSTSLIIAHSNGEVRVINELVRLIRKERGELGEREFQCTTLQGKIFISQGDRIEFRKNDPELGITNGLTGILREAEPDRFVVTLQTEDRKKQTIVFNPQQYRAFQLGYATTYFRSQGRTIDRAYILHSPMMNQEMLYVGLTRHVRNVHYFVSKDQVYCLADLKRQAIQSGQKELTVEFTTPPAFQAQKEQSMFKQQVDELKASPSVFDKLKGYGLQAWDRMASQTSQMMEDLRDLKAKKEFYSPVIPPVEEIKLPVVELEKTLTESNHPQDPGFQAREAHAELASETPQQECFSFKNIEALSADQRSLAAAYQKACEKADLLKWMVASEVETSGKKAYHSTHFKEWQEACGKRNQAAYTGLQRISSKELESVLEGKAAQRMQEQASRYERSLAKRDSVSGKDLEERLKAQLGALLSMLYPEGPTHQTRTALRFGRKGSLSIAAAGEKAGQFYDFENREGGGLLKLIQRELGLGKVEARIWAQEFLGIADQIRIPLSFSKARLTLHRGDDWVSLRPDPICPAPALDQLKGKRVEESFKEVTRHAYRNENGQLLYYVLRLESRDEPGKKITPPLSYGYWKSRPGVVGWELKGYKQEKRTLYNVHRLKENPHAPVLIVEGEKTADHALDKLKGEGYICLTWPGGAGAVQKADWSPIQGRKVMVWPDNDEAGYRAAEDVARELRRGGVSSLQMVDKAELKRYFPEKWDLADPLPKGVTEQHLKKLLVAAPQKGINPEQVMHRLVHQLGWDCNERVLRARVNEILWRVDERMRAGLEHEYGGSDWKVHEKILGEVVRIFINQDRCRGEIQEKLSVKGVLLERMTDQAMMYEAQEGKRPKLHELQMMKEVAQGLKSHERGLSQGKVREFVKGPILKKAREREFHSFENERVKNEGKIYKEVKPVLGNEQKLMHPFIEKGKEGKSSKGLSI